MPSPPSPSNISSLRSPSSPHSTPPTSTSLSPAPSTTPPPRPYTDPFDADSDDDNLAQLSSPATNAPETIAEHSDFPLLRRTHLTTGYRAGLSAGKEDPEIAQRGFDAGYAIGATLGASVGWVLGALAALKAVAGRGGDEAKRTMLSEKVKEVEEECSVERLAEIVEGVKGPQTVEEREGGGDVKALGLREAERVVERWVVIVEALCRECGFEMSFSGMKGEAIN